MNANNTSKSNDVAADYFDKAELTNNPFASSIGSMSFGTSNPFDAPAQSETKGPSAYVLTKSGPELVAEEFEKTNVFALEVMVLWGETVLHAAHLSPPRSYYVGEEERKNLSCDFFVPEEKIGCTRAPIVLVDGSCARVVLLTGATGHVELPGKGKVALRELAAMGLTEPCPELAGALCVALPLGARARICVQDMVFIVNAVNAGRTVSAGAFADRDWTTALYVGLSSAVHVGLLAAVASFMPPMGITDNEGMSKDQLYLIQQYLNAAAERENAAAQPEDAPAEVAANNQAEGGKGTRSVGAEGSMGSSVSHNTNGRFAIAGPQTNKDIQVARERAKSEAASWGLIGVLNQGTGGDPNAPIAAWGGDFSRGNDPISANGNMWGERLAESNGAGGLGLTGIGEGSGGSGFGIGLGNIGTVGHGAGNGDGQGIGNGAGLKGRGHVPTAPRVIIGSTIVNGRLPSEVIQRIVRQNYGRFRLCYENGLRGNPSLQGRVSVRFVIGRDGSVSNVSNSGSDMPDQAVTQCVVRSYYGLSFPEPENGIVTVVYPIVFTPGG